MSEPDAGYVPGGLAEGLKAVVWFGLGIIFHAVVIYFA